jgi:iron(III) transport system permease protein
MHSVLIFPVLAVLIALPVGILLYAAFLDTPPQPGSVGGVLTLRNFQEILQSEQLPALRNSLTMAALGTVLAVLGGGLLAWLAARTNVPMKRLVKVAGISPLFMSSLVGALAWSYLGSPNNGYINVVLRDFGIPIVFNINSLPGISFVFGLYYAPYAFLFLFGALSLINPELEDAASVHGANLRRTLMRVTFRLAAPAVLGTSLLIFVLIIENFPVPRLLGSPSGIGSLPGLIYSFMTTVPVKSNQAAAVSGLLMVVMLFFIWAQRKILSSREYTTVTGRGFRPKQTDLGVWRWPAAACVCLYMIFAVVLPFFALFQMAFRKASFVRNAYDLINPDAFTSVKFTSIFSYEPFYTGMTNSLLIGACCAFFGGILYLYISYVVFRTKTPGRAAMEYLAMSPVAVPAISMGLAFLWTWVVIPLPFKLYGTIGILVLAFIAIFMPQGFRGMSSSIRQVHPELEESALVCGATRVTAARKVLIPLIRGGIIGTMMLIFILSIRELSVALFLYTSETQVLAITIFDAAEGGNLSVAAGMSILYSFILLLITVVAQRWMSVGEGKKTIPT